MNKLLVPVKNEASRFIAKANTFAYSVSKRVEGKVLMLAAVLGLSVAATSGTMCWLLSYHQRECPKSLIKED